MAVAAPLNLTRSGHVVIGVDTHKYVHVATVMDSILASLTIATDTGVINSCSTGRPGSGKSSDSASREPAPTGRP